MVTDLRQKLLASFEVEHREHLEAIRSGLTSAQSGPATVDLQEIYRRAHSLKGAARAVDFAAVETLAHRLETLFSMLQSGAAMLDNTTKVVIHGVLDAVEDWVAAYNSHGNPEEPSGALAEIDRWLSEKQGSQGPAAPASPPSSGGKAQRRHVSLVATRPRERPPPELVDGEASVGVPAADAARATAPGGTAADRDATGETLRVSAKQLDRLLGASGILAEDGIREEAMSAEIRTVAARFGEMERASKQFASRFGGMLRRLEESPEHRRLVAHMVDLDRRVRALSKEVKGVAVRHESLTWALRQHIADVQEEVQAARMVTADSVFVGFRKLVRDLARDEGKEVDFELRGMETVADRMILQGLKDAVMHMLRNAVSHGIEAQQERRAGGKPAQGRITLDVSTHGGRITVSADDDGRGIDFDKARKVAAQRRIIDPEQAETLDRAAICDLLLQSGFSTAGSVTRISGRGIGLSAAYEAAVRLQGTLEFPQKDGPGTTVMISVPLRVSSQRIVFVTCRGHTFGLLAAGIESLTRVRPDDVETVDGQPTLRLGKEMLPMRPLGHLLGLGEGRGKGAGRHAWVIIVRSGQRRLAVTVDAFLYVRDAVIKSVEGAVSGADLAAGAVQMQEGAIALVLNLPNLLKSPLLPSTVANYREQSPRMEPAQAEILVVDDSITTRTLEKSILEAHGYTVRVSVDGMDALRAMREKLPDLVVSDLEMPRLDGVGLLREIKRDRHLSAIPIILVTSREKDEDRDLGLSLGADEYIVKSKFDQRNLLATIERLLWR